MQLHTEIERYLIARRQEGLSPATIEQYQWHLSKLTTWLKEKRGIEQAFGVTRDTLREWGADIRDQWSPATCKTAIVTCRGLFAWLLEEQEIEENPALALKTPKVPQRIQRTITSNELRTMLSVCDQTIKGHRDRAILNLLIDTGLRNSEICSLRLADVDLNQQVAIATVKGGHQDLAYFAQASAQTLQAWIDVRCAAPGVGTLFVAIGGIHPGHPLTTRGLRIIVRRIGESANIKGVCPHAFRRGFACIATDAGAPTRIVQLAGRWSNIQMVERYTAAMKRGKLHRGGWSPADHINKDSRPPDP